jgi:hypothetical protein
MCWNYLGTYWVQQNTVLKLTLCLWVIEEWKKSEQQTGNKVHVSKAFDSFSFLYSFIHMCIHCLGHFSSPNPLTSRQNLFCPFLQFCWRVDKSNNKKDKVFLLVEIRIAIQRDSKHCFHAHVYYNRNWFISTWPLHYFPISHLSILTSIVLRLLY